MPLWKKVLGSCLVVGVISLGSAVSANAPQPGSAEDPIISKSYVDEQIARLRAELGGKGTTSPSPVQPTPPPVSSTPAAPSPSGPSVSVSRPLVVEELQTGQSLIAFEGTELIVRTGQATVILGANGDGIPDLTDGKDLGAVQAPLNHLLLIPRSDGRGVKVTKGPSHIMIRGPYEIR